MGTTYRVAGAGGRYASLTMSNLRTTRQLHPAARARAARVPDGRRPGASPEVSFVVGLVLSIVGVVGAWLPIIAFIVAALCIFGFLRTTGQR